MRFRHAVLTAGLALGSMSATAHAAYIIDISQVGGNVVATGSGSIDLSGLTFQLTQGDQGVGVEGDVAVAYLGAAGSNDLYTGVIGPTSFGLGPATLADTSQGAYVGLTGVLETVFVPAGYTSGSSLGLSRDVFVNQTIASLGLTTGNYTYTLGADPGADTLTVNISDSVSSVPLPASAPMLGTALVALGALGYGLRRTGKPAT